MHDYILYSIVATHILLQCVAPFSLATKMAASTARGQCTKFWMVDPVSFAKAAMATIGIKRFTHGCFAHAIEVSIPPCMEAVDV